MKTDVARVQMLRRAGATAAITAVTQCLIVYLMLYAATAIQFAAVTATKF